MKEPYVKTVIKLFVENPRQLLQIVNVGNESSLTNSFSPRGVKKSEDSPPVGARNLTMVEASYRQSLR